MDLTEKTIEEKIIYSGNKMTFYVDKVLLPNGEEAIKEGIKRAHNAVILGITNDNKIIMEGQFRHPFKEEIISLPAGKSDGNETFIETAKREFEEEVGLKAKTWIDLGSIYPAPAYSNEEVRLFIARDLYQGNIKRDEDEFLNVFEMYKEEFYYACFNGRIKDARTIIAAYKLKELDK